VHGIEPVTDHGSALITVRQARPTDVQKFSRYIMPPNFIGVVAEDETKEIIGAGWIVWGDQDRPWVCFEGTEAMRPHKQTVARWSLRLLRAAQQTCDELYTIEDTQDLRGSRWLEWLGFRPTGETIKGLRVLKWQKQS
jgi:hypothetical protein